MTMVGKETALARERMIDACGLLREHWYAAALSRELPGKAPISRVVMELPIVLWRSVGGVAVAMEDRCAHRNAPLSKGRVFEGRIGCPYHGWVYDKDGVCVSVPSDGPATAPPGCKVQGFPVRERHGLIWVWMGDGEPSGEPFPMPYLDTPGWGAYFMVTGFANEVTHLVENFMDVPHTRFVHFGWFRKPSGKRVRVEVERTPDSVLVTYHLPEDKIGFASRILNPDGEPTSHTDKFYMPNTTRVDYSFGSKRGFTITSTCTPRGAFDTMVYTLISYKLGWMNLFAPLWLPFYTRKVIRQDVDIMKIHGDNLRRFGGETRFHSTAADLLHEFIESLRDHRGSRAPASNPQPTVPLPTPPTPPMPPTPPTPPTPRKEEVFFWI